MTRPLELITSTEYSGFICINKLLIKKVGLNQATLIGLLSSSYEYWYNKELSVKENGYFYVTSQYIEESTGLSYHQQLNSFKELEKLGLISTKKIGMPSKKYFKLNSDNIESLLSDEKIETQGFKKLKPKDLKNSTQIINDNNNIKDNNINTKVLTEQINDDEILIDDKIIKKSSKSFNNLMIYIDSLNGYKESTINNLKEWVKTIGIGFTSIKQLQNKLIRINNECNGDLTLVDMSIKNALDNNWRAFYKPTKSQINSYIQSQVVSIKSNNDKQFNSKVFY